MVCFASSSENGALVIEPGQFRIVIPRSVEHRPVADGVVQVVFIEPATTVNTGNVDDAKTVTDLECVSRTASSMRSIVSSDRRVTSSQVTKTSRQP